MSKAPYKNWSKEDIEKVKNNEIPEGKTYAQCSYFCRAHLKQGFRPVKGKVTDDRNERGRKYIEMHEKGMTYTQIAKSEGVTRQRVHAVVESFRKYGAAE